MRAIIWLTGSYIPWIVYWAFSAEKMRVGTIFMFFITLGYIVVEKKFNHISIMDVTAMFYSIVAMIADYIIQTELFVIGDGYMGYGTLFLMGIISIYTGHPFMKYYIEKERRKEPIKDVVNVKISKVWTGVFLVDTFIFILIKVPIVAVISSNVFVIIGIIVTIYYLLKM